MLVLTFFCGWGGSGGSTGTLLVGLLSSAWEVVGINLETPSLWFDLNSCAFEGFAGCTFFLFAFEALESILFN